MKPPGGNLDRTKPLGRNVPLLPGSSSLSRTGWTLARRSGIRPVSARRESAQAAPRSPRTETGFSRAVKLLARTRAGNGDPDEACCEATGVWLGRYGGEIQHRDARGMGGTSDPVTNSIVNAVLLSKEAHRLAESRDARMNAMGFWLKNGQDPRTEPVMLHGAGGGITAWLAPDGRYLFEAPEVAA